MGGTYGGREGEMGGGSGRDIWGEGGEGGRREWENIWEG